MMRVQSNGRGPPSPTMKCVPYFLFVSVLKLTTGTTPHFQAFLLAALGLDKSAWLPM